MKRLLIGAWLIACSGIYMPAEQAKPVAATNSQTPAPARTGQTTGDDVFQATCQRCHAPPMSISPRVAGTVLMHMRNRARLSREDEVKLLRFIAP